MQQELYPELDDFFRWGGFFVSGGADLMHFDISGGNTDGGNSDNGLFNWRRSQIENMVSFELDDSKIR